MILQPDYKLLYEQSQKKLVDLEAKSVIAEKQIADLEQQLQLALLEVNQLRRKLFGLTSDNRVKKAKQGELDILPLGATGEDVSASEDLLRQQVGQQHEKQQVAAEKRKKDPHGSCRMVLPEHLEREEVIIDPAGDLNDYQVIGEEVTEVLVLVPASFKVRRIIRRKWALKSNHSSDSKGVLIAAIPSRTVKRGLFDESVLAHLLISKYIDHPGGESLPLYRQKKIFEREGMVIPSSTLTDNTAAACQVLKPVYNALKREVLANLYLQADETSIKVLESEKKNACHLGYYWAYHAPVDGLVLFDYQPGRGQDGPKKLLADFTGVLQSDGYAVYQALFNNSDKVNQLYCMAHIRRKFDEAVSYDQARATYAVEQIAKLYKIEKDITEAVPALSESQIVEIRREQASPILGQIKAWMLAEYGKVLPKSPIGRAIRYALPLWDNMCYYTLHGHLRIDNNGIENAIRPIALGRKNYLFAGTHHTAQNAAMVYSLFATCKKHDVNPQQWLMDVLQKLNDPEYEGKFSDLLPHRWKMNQS